MSIPDPASPPYQSQPDHAPLVDEFHSFVSNTIDEEGFHPAYSFARNASGHLTVSALAVPPVEAYAASLCQIRERAAVELVFGLDRYAKSGQGTSFADLVAGHYYFQGVFYPFVVEYRHSPRSVMPVCWTNEFWNGVLRRELTGSMARLRADLRVPVRFQ